MRNTVLTRRLKVTKTQTKNFKILALDTATSIVSVALAYDGIFKCEINREPNRHTESLIPMVDRILKEAQLTMKDLDAVAFGAGPGAFTGLRAACGTAQGLAWAADIAVVAVGNLEAGASHLQSLGVRGRVLIANDARMNECYTAVFDITDDGIEELVSPCLVTPQSVFETIQTSGANIVSGSALTAYAQELRIPEAVQVIEPFETTAQDIARVALTKFALNEITTPQLAAPLYVRNRVALTIEERKAGEKL